MRSMVADSVKLTGLPLRVSDYREEVVTSFRDRVGNGVGLTFERVRVSQTHE